MESNALKRCDVIIMNDSDVVDLFSNCRYLPVFSVQGHKRVSSTNEWMSSRLTFPKLLSIWQKQSATWVLDGIFDSCCQMSDYLSGNSSVKCQIARYLNCTLILPSLWDGAVLFLTVPPFIHLSNPNPVLGLEILGSACINLSADFIQTFNLSMLLNPQTLQDLESLQNHFAMVCFSI